MESSSVLKVLVLLHTIMLSGRCLDKQENTHFVSHPESMQSLEGQKNWQQWEILQLERILLNSGVFQVAAGSPGYSVASGFLLCGLYLIYTFRSELLERVNLDGGKDDQED